MQLGTKGRYAVMAMIELVIFEKEQDLVPRPLPLSRIARHLDISVLYLEQLFSKLKRKGLVQSIRGTSGGYILGRPAKDISLVEIMDAVGESLRVTRCSGEKGCLPNQTRCKVHHVWAEVENRIYDYLHSLSLETLYLEPKGCVSLDQKDRKCHHT